MADQVILCYHKVGPLAQNGKRLNVEPESLARQVAYFCRRGPVVLVRDLAPAPTGRFTAFTFDDAYADTMLHAPEILDREGVRGTFYAVPNLVGQTSAWDGELASPLADWPSLRTAAERGHEIGNHTADHSHLDRLSLDDQVAQLVDARKRLEEHELRTTSVCFPYGSHDANTMHAMDAAGYRVGVALRKRPTFPTEDRRRLSRVVVGYSDGLALLLYRIHVRPRLKRQNDGV